MPQARWIGSCRDSSQRRTWAFSADPHRTKTEPDGSGALVERYDRQLAIGSRTVRLLGSQSQRCLYRRVEEF